MRESDGRGGAADGGGRKHEPDDIRLRPILTAVAILLGTVAIVHVALVWFQDHIQTREHARSLVGVNPLAARRNFEPTDQRLTDISPPRLEGLQELRDDAPPYRSTLPTPTGNPPQFHPENLRPENWPSLTGYAWVDKDHGVARIPIDQAMKAILTMNRLRTQPGGEDRRPSTTAAERMRASSSGRTAGGGSP